MLLLWPLDSPMWSAHGTRDSGVVPPTFPSRFPAPDQTFIFPSNDADNALHPRSLIFGPGLATPSLSYGLNPPKLRTAGLADAAWHANVATEPFSCTAPVFDTSPVLDERTPCQFPESASRLFQPTPLYPAELPLPQSVEAEVAVPELSNFSYSHTTSLPYSVPQQHQLSLFLGPMQREYPTDSIALVPPYSSPPESYADSDSSGSEWDGLAERSQAVLTEPAPIRHIRPARRHAPSWHTTRPTRSDALCGSISCDSAGARRPTSPRRTADLLNGSFNSQEEPERRDSDMDTDTQQDRARADSRRSQKMHECSLCHKRFPRPSGLATHMNTHSGAKPFKCPVSDCAKSFAVRSNAKRHLRTHGIRAAPDVAFGYLSALSGSDLAMSAVVPMLNTSRDVSATRQRWMPQSLLVKTNCDWLRRYGDGTRCGEPELMPPGKVVVPLPPVVPSVLSEGYDTCGRIEERNSFAEAACCPYHPNEWQALPGPSPVPLKMHASVVLEAESTFFL
ncbi:hypothetical protein EVG20_g5333 [Dentipellis fragilis]|uniref:C2H2-type domain-containing protein n=1 Tax=Dentipellis fragilis TaxID=205917 RepID=A0A4Y9YT70_9AGAM|nr:hypothetical protein EVG20_g5333 [Dentipellis fragilis]